MLAPLLPVPGPHGTISSSSHGGRTPDPVHSNEIPSAGRYWSVTKYDDVREVDGDWKNFSSASGITLGPKPSDGETGGSSITSFISMDPPTHGDQRRTVRSVAAPKNLRNLEPLIRERTIAVLDSLPEGEPFDWVDTVSVELTTMLLGTLWELKRENPGDDLVSMLVHGEATKALPTLAHLGNLLFMVGGNDTTRNTMSGSIYGLNKFSDQYDKLAANPDLVPSMVPEIIRWQTPLSYMRRTATQDCELGGKQILKDDQVLMWYLSANRDEDVLTRRCSGSTRFTCQAWAR